LRSKLNSYIRNSTRLIALLLILCCFILAGCTSKADNSKAPKQSVAAAIQAAEGMSEAQLYEKAKAELKYGEVHFYSFTSIAEQAAKNFVEQYPEFKGKLHFHDLDDESYYNTLLHDMETGKSGIDFMLTHSDLMEALHDKNLIYHYFPKALSGQVAEAFQKHANFGFLNTIFIYNSTLGKPAVANVWELTEKSWEGKIIMKDPLEENVNMNFLVMLTSPQWLKRLEEAYVAYYNKPWSSTQYENIAYEWIDRFLQNCDFGYESNTAIAKALSKASGKMALTGYNKLRKLKLEDLARVEVWEYTSPVQGFAGFAYGAYAGITKNCDCPYASALFINYILTEKGFAGKRAWNSYQGYYSTNTSIAKKDVNKDFSFSYWKDKLVLEDPEYISKNYKKVTSFVLKCLSNKNLKSK